MRAIEAIIVTAVRTGNGHARTTLEEGNVRIAGVRNPPGVGPRVPTCEIHFVR